jgi:class 3 adenylate cyclase
MPGSPATASGAAMTHDTPFYREGTFHALVGAVLIGGAFLGYRLLRARLRWRAGPAGFVSEAVLAVDLTDSTRLATHYGEAVALRARNALEEQVRRLTETARTYLETTGDGCLVTFPAVTPALEAAVALVREWQARPPGLGPAGRLDVRIGVTYGEILLDARGARHGAAINKAYRLLGVKPKDLAEVKLERGGTALPERTRILVDEDAAQEADRTMGAAFIGYARLRGFTGLHGVYEVTGQPEIPPVRSAAPVYPGRRASDSGGGTP